MPLRRSESTIFSRQGAQPRNTEPPPFEVSTREQGGFYHDGRFATLKNVVEHYNRFLTRGLDADESYDLVQYLRSL